MSELVPKSSSRTEKLSQFRLFIQMMQDYFAKRYTNISKWTWVSVIVAVLYFLSPIDIIPDFAIPFVGYVDDAFVLGFMARQLMKEIKKYEIWKNTLAD